jgi:hypothetical protein
MQRRDFLSLLTGSAVATALPVRAATTTPVLAAWAEELHGTRRYFAGRLDGRAIELPARGHALVPHPREHTIAYVCARRPGEYLFRFDTVSGALLNRVDVDDTHRFEGHAVIDNAHDRLVATESELENGEGRLGIYAADSLAKLDEWPTHGIGPHELIWLARDVLVVANGGILTLPETGRMKRNLDSMEPSLVTLDARDGHKLAAFTLPDRKLSIRHLALAADGTLGVALQYEGANATPLLAVLRDQSLRLVDVPEDLAPRLGGYAAAVAACGDRFAVSCTHGDCVVMWDTRGRYVGHVAMRKPAGIVRDGAAWLVSNEFGELWRIHAEHGQILERRTITGRRWDNHMASATA